MFIILCSENFKEVVGFKNLNLSGEVNAGVMNSRVIGNKFMLV